MPFLKNLFLLAIFPILFAISFPGNSYAGKETKRFLNSYPYHILISDKSSLNRLLFILFSKTKSNKRPFINYTKIFYIVLSISQVPIAIIVNYLKLNIFTSYFWILIAICLIPQILLFIMVCILEHKEKEYKKKMGLKIDNFWEDLKSDRKFNALEKQRKFEESICNAIEPYIITTNPKKRKTIIFANDIEKVNEILKNKFPQVYTEQITDEKGNNVFCVYYNEKGKTRILVRAHIKNKHF